MDVNEHEAQEKFLRDFIREFQHEFSELNFDYMDFAADRFIEYRKND
jgi:hypothetical protein